MADAAGRGVAEAAVPVFATAAAGGAGDVVFGRAGQDFKLILDVHPFHNLLRSRR